MDPALAADPVQGIRVPETRKPPLTSQYANPSPRALTPLVEAFVAVLARFLRRPHVLGGASRGE